MATGSARSARVMSYIYLGAAVQLLLILSALRVTAVQALQATQSKQTSDALRRARAVPQPAAGARPERDEPPVHGRRP